MSGIGCYEVRQALVVPRGGMLFSIVKAAHNLFQTSYLSTGTRSSWFFSSTVEVFIAIVLTLCALHAQSFVLATIQ